MTADSYSPTLGWLLMGTGNDNNTWGTSHNTSVSQIFEDSIANILSSAVTGGTLDLSASPPPAGPSAARYWMLKFTGTLTGNQICQVPNLSKGWWVYNNTSGAFTLTFKTPAGAASSAITQGGWLYVWCDGSNVVSVSPYGSTQTLSPDGTAALPSKSWANATSTGWYRAGAGDFRFSFAGTDQIKITSGVVDVVSGALKVGGVAVGTGTVTTTGAITSGHLATWNAAAVLQDGGVAGALANLNSLTSQYLASSALGLNVPLNLEIDASVAGNALTVAIKGINGSDPSASNPVLIPFRNATLTSGQPVISTLAAALSFTVTATNTLGTSSSNVPFRLWVIAYYNGGSVAVGLFNASTQSSTGVTIYPLAEGGLATTASGTGGGSSAGTHYANVSAIGNTPFRILGYLEWGTGLATAGTWASGPTTIQLFGPGIKKPGDVVQAVYATTTTSSNHSGAGAANKTATNLTGTITPTSAVNPIKVEAHGLSTNSQTTGSHNVVYQIYRGTGTTAIGSMSANGAFASGDGGVPVACFAFDNPQSISATQYGVYGYRTGPGPTGTFLSTQDNIPANTGTMLLEEIMG